MDGAGDEELAAFDDADFGVFRCTYDPDTQVRPAVK
jgi:hypothetical protein